MITEAQREARKAGIFSTDAARIMMGDSVRVFLEKTGEVAPEEISEMAYVQLGNKLEAAVLDALEVTLWKDISKDMLMRSPDTLISGEYPWLGCHLDAFAGTTIVEAKAVGVYNKKYWGAPGTDEVPDRVLFQTQEQMAVTGAKTAIVPVCFATEPALTQFIADGTVPIEIYEVPRSETLISAIIDECGVVWDHIQKGTMPTPRNIGDARLLYSKGTGGIIEGGADIASLCAQLNLHDAELALAERKKAEIAEQIQAFMGEATEVRHHGKTIVTWKRAKDSRRFLVK